MKKREPIQKLRAQAEACRKILGYDDGDLLDNVTRYKAYAEHEIQLLRNKLECAITCFFQELENPLTKEVATKPKTDYELLAGFLKSEGHEIQFGKLNTLNRSEQVVAGLVLSSLGDCLIKLADEKRKAL